MVLLALATPSMAGLLDPGYVLDSAISSRAPASATSAAAHSLDDSAGVLLIGDSLTCGPFGQDLLRDLTAKGKNVTLYCSPGSEAKQWALGKNKPHYSCSTRSSAHPSAKACNGDGSMVPIRTLLKKYPGAHVMVALGANSIADPAVNEYYDKVAAEIKASGHRCDWIGPPHVRSDQVPNLSAKRLRRLTARQIKRAERALRTERQNLSFGDRNINNFYDSLEEASSNCTQVDSRSGTAPGTPGSKTIDGLHRGPAAAAYWEANIMRQLFPDWKPEATSVRAVTVR